MVAAAATARCRQCRGAVLLLLLTSVLAPLVLYGKSPFSPLSDSTVVTGAFDREDRSILVWPQMVASEVSLAKDLTIERLGEHKNRVLSATDDWQAVEAARSHSSEKSDASVQQQEPRSRDADEVIAEGNDSAQLRQDGRIKEVISRVRNTDGFGDPGARKLKSRVGEGMKETELLDASEIDHKDGSGAAGENNIAGMHTTANLSSSLKKGKSVPTPSRTSHMAEAQEAKRRGGA